MSKLLITGLNNPTKTEWMLKAFEKRNVHPVTKEKGDKEEIKNFPNEPRKGRGESLTIVYIGLNKKHSLEIGNPLVVPCGGLEQTGPSD